MSSVKEYHSLKVPQVTLAFWIIKIAATTLGETAGDAVSMTMQLGYALSTALFFAFFLAVVTAQVKAVTFHKFLYWTVIVATTTVGTTMADFFDRSLGIGYTGGALILFALLMFVLSVWKRRTGTIAINSITSHEAEIFYWMTILFSNTLGTALGDFLADDTGLGFGGGSLVFAGLLLVIALIYFGTRVSHTLLFWAAFVLTRPLGATLGDLLTKPHEAGGLNLDRVSSSLVLATSMLMLILLTSFQGDRKSDQVPDKD